MAATITISKLDSNFEVDKLTYEIFSILENIFLFGYDNPKISLPKEKLLPLAPMKSDKYIVGKVGILSHWWRRRHRRLAAKSLVHLESNLQQNSKNPSAKIVNYFDVVTGSDVGGILAALLFMVGKDVGQMFSVKKALKFIIDNRRKFSRKTGGFCQYGDDGIGFRSGLMTKVPGMVPNTSSS